MDKIWLKSYPPGVPAEIETDEFASLDAMLAASVARHPEKVAFIGMGASLTYADFDRHVGDFAACLRRVLGLPKGAHVAVMLPNVLTCPVCIFGVLRAGCVVVNCNPLYTASELEFQLRDSGAGTIVVLESFAHVLAEIVDRTRVDNIIVVRLGDLLGPIRGALVDFVARHLRRKVPAWKLPRHTDFATALALGRRRPFLPETVAGEDTAFLQYTGGTTGVCKGAMLTHRNMLANLAQAHAWVRGVLAEGAELVLTALPLYHIFAIMANLLLFVRIGGSNLLIADPRDVRGLVRQMAKHSVTALTGVNTLFDALLRDARFVALDLGRLKVSLGGGASIQKSVAERWQALTGRPLIEAYGLTETSPAVTINPLDIPEFNGSIGLPLPSTEIAIRDDDGRDLGIGEAGELCVRGPQVMRGYFKHPQETAHVFTADGFLRTGDVVTIDEAGFLRIVDRKKDLILVSGFNVYPNEVEDVLAMHPGVLEAAAVGVPDERTGEAVKIFVVRRDASLTRDELIRHCRQYLTPYKRPRQVEFRSELPKSPLGKTLRRRLREQAPGGG